MTGRDEELALERLAVEEHSRRATAFWEAGNYREAYREQTLARHAERHVERLESEAARAGR